MSDLVYHATSEISQFFGGGRVLVGLLGFLVWRFPAVLVHELGHAVAALALTRGRVIVCVGTSEGLRWQGRRILLLVSPTARSGLCVSDATTWRAAVLIAAGGPLANILMSGYLALVWYGRPAWALVIAPGVLVAAASAFMSLLPSKSAVGLSDGLQILRLLRLRPVFTVSPAPPAPPREGR